MSDCDEAMFSESSDEEDAGRHGDNEGIPAVVSRLGTWEANRLADPPPSPRQPPADISSLPSWAQRVCAGARGFGAVHVDWYTARLEAMLLEQPALTLSNACAMACACRTAVIELHLSYAESLDALTDVVLVTMCILEDLAEGRPIETADGLTVPLQLHFPTWNFGRGTLAVDQRWCRSTRPAHDQQLANNERPIFQRQFAELAHVLQPVPDIPVSAYQLLCDMKNLCQAAVRQGGAWKRTVVGGTTLMHQEWTWVPKPFDEQDLAAVRAFRCVILGGPMIA